MYDSIDITHNKNLYNFDKLNKLISHKELLYNAIIIYYILYNKFNNISSDTKLFETYNVDDNINNLVINNNVYNTYEAEYKNLCELLIKKIDNLEKKLKETTPNNDYEKIKLELEEAKQKLKNSEKTTIDKENSNINTINNHIAEYDKILKKNELESHIEYLNNIISNNTNNSDIILKYKEDIENLKEQLILSTDRINELNVLLKKYILNNNRNIEQIKILEKQIETTEIYKTENIEKIKNLETLLEDCRKNKNDLYKKEKYDEQEKIVNEYKTEVNTLNNSINILKNDLINLKENENKTKEDKEEIKNLRDKMEILEIEKTKLKNILNEEQLKINTYVKKEQDLNLKIKNYTSEIDILEGKKVNLEESLKKLENDHKLMLINYNEKKFMNEMNKNKNILEQTNLEILNNYQKNKIEIDIELKLKEKSAQENILNYIIENLDIDKNELRIHLNKLKNTNETNNKIIENININIRKINNLKDEEEKNRIRLINKNLNNSLEENKIVFNELKKNTDTFLEENKIGNKEKIELLRTLFNILHINTSINLLNNINNQTIETNNNDDLNNIKNLENLIKLYNKKIEVLHKNYETQKYFINKLEKNNEMKENELIKLKQILEDSEIKKIYDDKSDELYDTGISLNKLESNIENDGEKNIIQEDQN